MSKIPDEKLEEMLKEAYHLISFPFHLQWLTKQIPVQIFSGAWPSYRRIHNVDQFSERLEVLVKAYKEYYTDE